jgi:hypothetical protein
MNSHKLCHSSLRWNLEESLKNLFILTYHKECIRMTKKLVLIYILFCITFSILTIGYCSAFDPESVQGAWIFDEGKGDQVLDSSGKEHHGTITANDAKFVKGQFGNAIEFLGGGKVLVPHADGFTTPIFTLMAWVKVPKIPNDWSMMIVGKDGWPNRNYAMYVASGTGQLHFAFCAVGKQDVGNINSQKVIADNKWHHVVMAYDMKMRRIYIDGELDTENPLSDKPSENTVDIEIGKGPVGDIDEVLIANQPFSADDIKLAMDFGLAKFLGGKAVSQSGKMTATWGIIKLDFGEN